MNNYINAKWLTGKGHIIKSMNPSNGDLLAELYTADELMINTAVESAKRAFIEWYSIGFKERLVYLYRFRDIVANKAEELSSLISLETGKLLWDAKEEVKAVISKLDLSVRAYEERCKPVSTDKNGIIFTTKYKPHGVLAVLGPYNFPCHLPNGHIIPALLSGNTVIFKPSEHSPLVGQKMIEYWDETGLPKGVINLIQGNADTARLLSGHADVDGVLFTGSVRAGIMLNRHLSHCPNKILALEMGGNNPIVVHEYSNIDMAIKLVILSAYISSGQRCTCARRLIIPNSDNLNLFIDGLCSAIEGLRVGLPYDVPEPFIGPLINIKLANSILKVQNSLVSKGSKVLVPIKKLRPDNLLSPGLIDVTNIDCEDEEYFGPMLRLTVVKNFDMAIEEANNTKYGLSASLLSDNEDLYKRFYLSIRAGIINWNRQTTGASGSLPFGGIGISGNHHPSGFFAVDYCNYPVASVLTRQSILDSLPPGIG